MFRMIPAALIAMLTLTACETTTTPMRMGADGKPVAAIYRIGPADAPRVRQRMQDGLNTMRAQHGRAPLTANAALASAAATHAQDMAFQSRPWHWGSDGSSPMQRAQRAGYNGALIGELISETFESEFETVNAWMTESETRPVILDQRAREVGVGWFQEENGKLWWAVVLGDGGGGVQLASSGGF